MTEIRMIHYSSENGSGSDEGIYLTDDRDMDASDACPYGCTVQSDQIIEIPDPSGLPLNWDLRKQM